MVGDTEAVATCTCPVSRWSAIIYVAMSLCIKVKPVSLKQRSQVASRYNLGWVLQVPHRELWYGDAIHLSNSPTHTKGALGNSAQ